MVNDTKQANQVFWEPSMLLKAKQQHINWMGALKIYRCLSNGKAKAKAIS
jgi:hypothetical protein